MKKLRIMECFGGIGACSKALERLGIDYEIADYVEIDKYAVKSFNAMHNTNFEPQDITTWDKDIDVDLVMHGSPCQDFSLAGLQAGGDEGSGTRSSLMYETIRIVQKLRPKYVIWENVKNLLSKKHRHNFDSYLEIMEKLGYANYYQVLNAKDYGIPQNRERVFTVSIRNDIDIDFIFPKKQELKLRLKDMLEDNVDEKYYLDDKWLNDIRYNNNTVCETRYDEGIRTFKNNICGSLRTIDACGNKCVIQIKNTTKQGYLEATNGDGIDLAQPNSKTRRGRVQKETIQTLTTQNNLGVCVIGGIGEKKSNGGTQWYQQDRIYYNNVGLSLSTTAQPYYQDKQLRIRKLTPKECWRLMGFDDEDFDKAEKVNSNTQLYKQAGNSIVVNVLEAIFKNLFID
jgi:DNA (cytosine-5)-methyltransferase 1